MKTKSNDSNGIIKIKYSSYVLVDGAPDVFDSQSVSSHSNLKKHELKNFSIFYITCKPVVCLHVQRHACMYYTRLSVCPSVCPQVDVSPVTALNLLLEIPPNTVNNTQRLALLTRAFTAAQSNGTANSLLLEVCNNTLKCDVFETLQM